MSDKKELLNHLKEQFPHILRKKTQYFNEKINKLESQYFTLRRSYIDKFFEYFNENVDLFKFKLNYLQKNTYNYYNDYLISSEKLSKFKEIINSVKSEKDNIEKELQNKYDNLIHTLILDGINDELRIKINDFLLIENKD